MINRNVMVVRRFYDDLWNQWHIDSADVLVADDVKFRGSLGTSLIGRQALKVYIESFRLAFPDWHNTIDDVIAQADRVVTRMTWTGTHRGRFGDTEPTGRRVEYVGAAVFRLADGVITEAWVVGDSAAFWRSLGKTPGSVVG